MLFEEKNRGETTPWLCLARMTDAVGCFGSLICPGGPSRVRAFFRGDGFGRSCAFSSSDRRFPLDVEGLDRWVDSVNDLIVGEVGSDLGVKSVLDAASNKGSQGVSLYVKPYRLMSVVVHDPPGLNVVEVGEAGW